MPYSNINAPYADAQIAAVKNYIAATKAILAEYAVNLTPEERKTIPSVENNRLEQVVKVLEYSSSHPEFVSGYLDQTTQVQNFKTYNQLGPIRAELANLHEMVDDLHHVLGRQLYSFSSDYYSNVKRGMKSNSPGATSIYDDLKKLFQKQGNRDHETPTPSELKSE